MLGRSPGGGHGNPPLYSCLENSKDRGAWQVTVHGVKKELDTTEVTEHACTHRGRNKNMEKVYYYMGMVFLTI